MKTWKIFKIRGNTIAYVAVNEKDNRDTSCCALRLVRKYFDDFSISGTQILAENEDKQADIPTFELYYPERFIFDGIEYVLDGLNCAL